MANAWGCRVGPPDEPAPADRVQNLFNDIELYPTKTQGKSQCISFVYGRWFRSHTVVDIKAISEAFIGGLKTLTTRFRSWSAWKSHTIRTSTAILELKYEGLGLNYSSRTFDACQIRTVEENMDKFSQPISNTSLRLPHWEKKSDTQAILNCRCWWCLNWDPPRAVVDGTIRRTLRVTENNYIWHVLHVSRTM